MELTGRIHDFSIDYASNRARITFEVNEKNNAINGFNELKDVEKLSIKAVKYRHKRSLNANAYFWELLGRMADVLGTDKDEVYLTMLGRYGVYTHVIVKPEAVEAVKREWRAVKELGEVIVNGKNGVQLQCYFGSSAYNTKEMSKLIDGTVSECKELGIETRPPEEIEAFCREWGA